jgi:AcrR family transcriptional regulator
MRSAERREQLLDVTKELVAEHGFHAVSIESVARRAGITRPIIYGHFGDLPSLFEALIEREGARALTQLAAILPTDLGGGDPRDQLFAAMEGYLRAAQADPATWRLVLMPPEGAPALLREHITRGREAVVAALAASVGPGVGTPDPELFARMLSALSDEAVRLLLTDPERYSAERLLGHTRWLLDRMTA